MPMDFAEIKGMSDDDFAAALNSGKFADVTEPTEPTEATQPTDTPPPANEGEQGDEHVETQEPNEPTDTTEPAEGGTVPPAGTAPSGVESDNPNGDDADANQDNGEGKAGDQAQGAAQNQDPDYKGFYDEVLGQPIKVNGKDITLGSAAEVKSLIEKGAAFTRNMQALASKKKTLMMLDQAGVTEDQLSLAIDLLNGNPEAIKKVLKEKAIDPLDLDMNVEPAYQAGSHQISDAQVRFQSQLDELDATPAGKETLTVIARDWDQASKVELGTNPAVMATIHAHRASGIYDRTVAEVERQRLLGAIPADTPFLQAYTHVGNQIQARNGFADLAPTTPAPKTAPAAGAPVGRSALAPKPAVKPNAAASAAAAPRSGTPAKSGPPNYKNVSDADIEKMAATMLAR